MLSLCHTALNEADKNGEVDKKFCAVLLAWIATIRRYIMEEQCTWHPGWSELPQRDKHVSYIPKLASRLWNTIPRMLLPKTLPVWWIDAENKVADHLADLAGLAADSLRFDAPIEEDVFFDSGEGQPQFSKQWHLQYKTSIARPTSFLWRLHLYGTRSSY